MTTASALPLLLLPRPASARPAVPNVHSRRLAVPPRPADFSAAPTVTRSRKAGRLEPLRAASCCNNGSSAAAGTAGGGVVGAQGWRLLAWYLMALDNNPVMTKAVTSAVLTLAGDLICQLAIDRAPKLDLKRTFVFTFLGLVLVGPTLHVWYLYLSKLVTISGASGAIARLLLDQFIFSPIFIGVFMSLLVSLEGKPSLVVPKLKQEWLSSVSEFLLCSTKASGSCCQFCSPRMEPLADPGPGDPGHLPGLKWPEPVPNAGQKNILFSIRGAKQRN